MDKKHAAGMCNLRNKKQEGKIKTMRLDKFLKVSRLIKRRTVANEACDAGRVMVNGKPAKASVNVKVGDVIEIAFGTKSVKVRVLDLQDTTKKEEAKDLFEYVSQIYSIHTLARAVIFEGINQGTFSYIEYRQVRNS